MKWIVIGVLAAVAAALTAGMLIELCNGREPHTLGFIGEKGHLDAEYRVHHPTECRVHHPTVPPARSAWVDRDFHGGTIRWTPGSYVDALPTSETAAYLITAGSPSTVVYEVRCKRSAPPADLLFRYNRNVVMPLHSTDGIVSGSVRRTIHAGRTICAEPLDRTISAAEGARDTYEVLSASAEIVLSSGRTVTLSQGSYGPDVFHPLLGIWAPTRWIGLAILVGAGALVAALAWGRHRVERPSPRGRRRAAGMGLALWGFALGGTVVGALLFLYDGTFRMLLEE